MSVAKYTAGKELTLEQTERIKAAQKRHAAIDPACINLTPEEFINWHPVGGITWEERAQGINARLRKNGLILLNSTGSLGHLPGTIEITLETAHWFTNFLDSVKNYSEYSANEKMYRAERNFDGNVIFTEIRKGGFASDLVFASWEIPNISDRLEKTLP